MEATHYFPFPDYAGPQVCVCGVRWCRIAIEEEKK